MSIGQMAGESLNCTAARKSTSRHNNNNRTASSNSLSSDLGDMDGRRRPKGVIPVPVTTRGGLRVYKVVILGDGGVGKSGE